LSFFLAPNRFADRTFSSPGAKKKTKQQTKEDDPFLQKVVPVEAENRRGRFVCSLAGRKTKTKKKGKKKSIKKAKKGKTNQGGLVKIDLYFLKIKHYLTEFQIGRFDKDSSFERV